MKRSVAVACGLAGLFFGAAAADAAPEPAPTLVLDPSPAGPGEDFTATLEDFCDTPGSEFLVEIAVDGGDSTSVTCQPNGLVATLTAPSAPGEYEVQANIRRRGSDPLIASASLVVQAEAPGVEEPLPDTGPEQTFVLTAVAGGVLVAGTVLFMTARSRRPSAR